MEKVCGQCKAEFKDNDKVVLDIMNTLTHEDCYKDERSFLVTEGKFKDLFEAYADLVD